MDPLQPPARPAARNPAKAVPPSDDAIAQQREAFDFETAERTELLREANVLRDMMLQQLKADDDALKKYIAMI